LHPIQIATEVYLEEDEEEYDWDTEWVNDKTGVSQEAEWFVEDEEKENADEVHLLYQLYNTLLPRDLIKSMQLDDNRVIWCSPRTRVPCGR